MVRASKFNHLFLSISVLSLAACGASHGVEPNKTAAPTPPVMESTSNLNTASKASAAGPVIDETTDPVMVPVNATLPEVLTQEDRLARLEEAVASLRTDYETIMPAFAQLNVTNTRVQALLDQIEAERGGVPVREAKAPVTTTTVTKVTSESDQPITTVETETVKTTVATDATVIAPPATPATAMASNVEAVRLGEHPGKTRIVIDLAGEGKVVPAYDLDNAEKLLVIDLPGVSTQGVASSLPKPSGLVAGITASETANGGNLVIQLKKDAKILLKEHVKAANGQPAKLVLDIGPAV